MRNTKYTVELSEPAVNCSSSSLTSAGNSHCVPARISKRDSSPKPAERMRDYVAAVKACLRAFRREEKLSHEGPFYQLTLLPGRARTET